MGSLLLYLGSYKGWWERTLPSLPGKPHCNYPPGDQLPKSPLSVPCYHCRPGCLPCRLVQRGFKWNPLTAGLFLCPSGYHGLYCEEEYNECLSAPCLNAATCRDLVNGYECVCLAEYKGEPRLAFLCPSGLHDVMDFSTQMHEPLIGALHYSQ